MNDKETQPAWTLTD